MAKKMKDFDWKKFFLEKGERVGLWTALGLMALMVVLGVTMVFTSGSPASTSGEIKKTADALKSKLSATNPYDLPPEDPAPVEVVKLDPGAFQPAAPLFTPNAHDDSRRRKPRVFGPEGDVVAQVIYPQIETYLVDGDPLKGQAKVKVMPGAEPKSQGTTPTFTKAGKASKGQPPLGAPALPVMKNQPGGKIDAADSKKITSVPLDKLEEELKQNHLVVDAYGKRLAIVVGQFPYRKQLEEFKTQLHFDTLADLWDSDSAPEFRGFEVQRRKIGKDGKEGEWEPYDLKLGWRDMVDRHTLFQWHVEPDNARVQLVEFPGLAMPRPPLYPGKDYPDLENQLPLVQKTVDQLIQDKAPPPPPPARQISEGFDIFNSTGGKGASDKEDEKKDMPAPNGQTRSRGKKRMPGAAPGEHEEAAAELPWKTPPEHVLIRLVDLDLGDARPGDAFEYQIRIRMTNPNYNKKDVAWPALAADKELTSEWHILKAQAVVPPDRYFYIITAVDKDQKEVPRLQLQGWFDVVRSSSDTFSVADWIVGEKPTPKPGEHVFGTVRTEVPRWGQQEEKFILATDPKNFAYREKVAVPFGLDGDGPVLVDIEGGSTQQPYKGSANAKPEKGVAVEVLILTPDGKLLARDSSTDNDDPDRAERKKAYDARVAEARNLNKPAAMPDKSTDPFSKSKPK